jgi:hypothetical protein
MARWKIQMTFVHSEVSIATRLRVWGSIPDVGRKRFFSSELPNCSVKPTSVVQLVPRLIIIIIIIPFSLASSR